MGVMRIMPLSQIQKSFLRSFFEKKLPLAYFNHEKWGAFCCPGPP